MIIVRRLRKLAPWSAKLALKLVLSRIPAEYRLWQQLAIFRHGAMDRPDYAYQVFRKHFERANIPRKQAFVTLEVGPGDSLFSATVAYAHGADKTWLVDTGAFAQADTELYKGMIQFLRSKGHTRVPNCSSLSEMLEASGGVYLTSGFSSLREIPSGSVDFIWSNAVLEHIRRGEFLPFMQELRRVLRADGVCSHTIDLQDHLGGSLNNLRFSERIWEAEWMAKSGFYTNRIQFEEMCRFFAAAGFAVEVIKTTRWPTLPLRRSELAEPFRAMTEESLLVRGFDVLLRPSVAPELI